MIFPCFKDKAALITGGTRGIGYKVAELLSESGCNLALVYRRDKASAELALETLSRNGINVQAIRSDIANEESVPEIAAFVKNNFGRLDYFVSNAVFGVLKPIGEFTAKRFDASMDANAKAFLLLSQAAADLMVPEGNPSAQGVKRIVALSSLGSHKVIPGYASIGASKAAIESLTRYLAVELAPRGIGVNAVSGGLVRTDSLKAFSEHSAWLEEQKNRTPMKRIAEPDDIARVVVWLLSDESAWITGQTIIADGGLSLV